MDIDKRIAEKITQLSSEELHYMAKLACLMRYCPGFNEELERIVPVGNGPVGREQLAATNDLMDKWLHKEEWAEILRPKLERMGVKV